MLSRRIDIIAHKDSVVGTGVCTYRPRGSIRLLVEAGKLGVNLIEGQLLLKLVMLLIGSAQLGLLPADYVLLGTELELQLFDAPLVLSCAQKSGVGRF